MSGRLNLGAPRATARRGRTRNRLLDAAVDVFAERGIDGATVELICERAGFSRGAFYSNFATKEELLFATAEHVQQRSLTRVEEAADRLGSGGPVQLDALVEHFFTGEDPRWVRIEAEVCRLAQTDPAAGALMLRMSEHIESRVLAVIDSVTAAHRLRLRAAPLVVVRTLVALYRQAAELAWLTGGPFDRTLLTSYLLIALESEAEPDG